MITFIRQRLQVCSLKYWFCHIYFYKKSYQAVLVHSRVKGQLLYSRSLMLFPQSSSQQRWRQIRVLPCRGPGSPLLSSSGPRWSECFHSRLRSAGEESRAAKQHTRYASCLCVNAAFMSLICAVKLNLTARSYTEKCREEVNEVWGGNNDTEEEKKMAR